MRRADSDTTAGMPATPFHIAAGAMLAFGLAAQMFLWWHQWIYGDQYALLTPAVQYLDSGELAPFSKMMSGGGRIPGTLLQRIIAWPLGLWADFRAPSLAMGLSQLAAVSILIRVCRGAYGNRFAAFFVGVYWLSPWRLYHSGFLWEPGFVFLPAAIHLGCCWVLRNRSHDDAGDIRDERGFDGALAGGLAGFVLGATLIGVMQIHASFMLLVVATMLLAWRRLIRLAPAGVALGAAAAGTTLLPTFVGFANGELPRIAPHIDERVPLPLLIMSNAGKAVLYWMRMGSADIGRRLRQTVWLVDGPPGTEAVVPLPAPAVVVVSLLSTASVLIAVYASWRYFVRDDGYAVAPGATSLKPGAAWLRTYCLVMLGAVALTAAISPVPVQGWHLLIALHAACIPVAVWLWRAFERRGAARILGIAFVLLLAATSIVLGLGDPMYLRPTEPYVLQQNIPELLRPLIPPGR